MQGDDARRDQESGGGALAGVAEKECFCWYKNHSHFHACLAREIFDHMVQKHRFNLNNGHKFNWSPYIATVGEIVGRSKSVKSQLKKRPFGHQNRLWILPNMLEYVGVFC